MLVNFRFPEWMWKMFCCLTSHHGEQKRKKQTKKNSNTNISFGEGLIICIMRVWSRFISMWDLKSSCLMWILWNRIWKSWDQLKRKIQLDDQTSIIVPINLIIIVDNIDSPILIERISKYELCFKIFCLQPYRIRPSFTLPSRLFFNLIFKHDLETSSSFSFLGYEPVKFLWLKDNNLVWVLSSYLFRIILWYVYYQAMLAGSLPTYPHSSSWSNADLMFLRD